MDYLSQKDFAEDMKNFNFKHTNTRHAFTMLELVFVIVVLGIIAALALPKLDRDLKQEAADTILSHIRYTQHLALSDHKHKFNEPKWQRAFWEITFESCSGGDLFIGVGTDMNYGGDTNIEEAATDPSNGKPMFWTNTASCAPGVDLSSASENIFITKKFGVTSVSESGGCTGKHIGFDHLGRPQVGFSGSNTPDYSSYMSNACTFTFTMSDGDTFAITIQPETGYSYISDQNAS